MYDNTVLLQLFKFSTIIFFIQKIVTIFQQLDKNYSINYPKLDYYTYMPYILHLIEM